MAQWLPIVCDLKIVKIRIAVVILESKFKAKYVANLSFHSLKKFLFNFSWMVLIFITMTCTLQRLLRIINMVLESKVKVKLTPNV